MSFRPFQTTANGSFTAQPSAAGEKVVVVSSATGDSGAVITINGSLSSTADSEDVTLTSNGRIERETTSTFDALTALSSDTTLTGVLSLYGQGSAASGDLTFASIPTEALTLELGLVGYTQTYTYINPARETILCPAGASLVTGAAPGSYVKIVIDATAHYFWFSNGSTTDPAPGGTGHAVTWNATDTVNATNLAAAITAVSNFCYASSGGTATVTVTAIKLGAMTVTQNAASFTLTAVQAGTADAANQIRTQYDVDATAATTTDVALWTMHAIRATEQYKIVCPAGSTLITGANPASYVSILLNGTTKYFWFSDGSTTDPAPGGTGYAVSFTGSETASALAALLKTSMDTNLTNFVVSRSTTTITIYGVASGVVTVTQDGGNDFTITGQAVAGIHYGTATAANAYATATASSTVTTLTDRIACNRSLGWTVTAPTGCTARTLIGGSNGSLLATLTGSDSIQVSQIFDNADLADNTLLASWTGATDALLVNGQPSTIRLAINNVSSAVTAKIQASDDGTTWYDLTGTTALTGTVAGTAAAYVLTGTSTLFTTELRVGDKITVSGYTYTVASIASATSLYTIEPLATSPSGTSVVKLNPVQISSLDNNSQFVTMPPVEYARLNITANANTTDSKLHAGLIC